MSESNWAAWKSSANHTDLKPLNTETRLDLVQIFFLALISLYLNWLCGKESLSRNRFQTVNGLWTPTPVLSDSLLSILLYFKVTLCHRLLPALSQTQCFHLFYLIFGGTLTCLDVCFIHSLDLWHLQDWFLKSAKRPNWPCYCDNEGE